MSTQIDRWRQPMQTADAQRIQAELQRRLNRLDALEDTMRRIQSALATDEEGSNLVSVARDAHKAEVEQAAQQRRREAGAAARYEGKPEMHNPYPEGTPEGWDWKYGWTHYGKILLSTR